MEQVTQPKFSDKPVVLGIGIFLTLLALTLHALSDQPALRRGAEDLTLFFVTYIFSAGYMIVALMNRKHPEIMSVALSLFYISCFSLNREMSIFSPFPVWLTVYMIVTQLSMLALTFSYRIPVGWKPLLYLIVGASFVFTSYLVLYLLPGYPFGIVGLILIGIGVHLYIPLFSTVQFIRLIRRNKEDFDRFKKWFWGGIAIPVIALGVYVGIYAGFKAKVDGIKADYEKGSQALPLAVYLNQYFVPSSLEETFMLNPTNFTRQDWFLSSGADHHHPGQVAAELFFGKPDLDPKEVDAIFNNLYAHRHENSPRLWSGRNLHTDSVKTEVDVFSGYRMAYVQKTIDVSNASSNPNNQQEAIYTFHLPEGAVGTSLSLWINGREEPARLSTKKKVREAYETIVGRERRDPAMMQWEDGNRLVVNVFPVTPSLPRKFKVGFTVPLKGANDLTYLNDIYFQGPDFSEAEESVMVHVLDAQTLEVKSQTPGFKREGNTFEKNGNAQSGWNLSWSSVPLKSDAFVFDNQVFHLENFHPEFESRNIQNLILDVNQWWHSSDLEVLWNKKGKAKVFSTRDDRAVEVTEATADELFAESRNRKFSLFPAHTLEMQQLRPEETLVVTKSHRSDPLLSDLKGSAFNKQLENYHHTSPGRFLLFDLATTSSSYVRSLDEAGIAQVLNGSVLDLTKLLENGSFPKRQTSDGHVAVPESGISVVRYRDSSQIDSKAPNHLMRVFNSRRIIEELSPYYFDRDSVQESSIVLAEQAYVVSPYSSLVSLESVGDYERFDIQTPEQKGAKSLGNSSIMGNGAVPEPHEWALIALAVVFFSWLFYRRFIA